MASPVPSFYSAAAGSSIKGGIAAPPPAYMSGKAVLEWATIANTSGLGKVNAFCGVAYRQDTGGLLELTSLAGQGHDDGPDNGVYSVRLDVDTPSVTTRKAASSSVAANVDYYSDGKPSARHTYWFTHWVPELSRYVLFGAKTLYGGAVRDNLKVDAFNPATNTWDGVVSDSPGTAGSGYPDLPTDRARMTCRDPATGNFYALITNTLYRWNPSAPGTYTSITLSGTGAGTTRGAQVWDTLRNDMFHLCAGDNFNTKSSTITCTSVSPTGVRQPITLSGSGLAEFQANASTMINSTVEYDNSLDCFYFYDGFAAATAGKVWKIVRTSVSTATITLLATTGVSVPVCPGGVNSKFRYIDALKCCVLVPSQTANIHFFRTQ